MTDEQTDSPADVPQSPSPGGDTPSDGPSQPSGDPPAAPAKPPLWEMEFRGSDDGPQDRSRGGKGKR
jgi:hypothetical protein